MTAKKKATKKTGRAQAKRVAGTGVYGREIVGVPPQMPSVVPLPDALQAFDAALTKVQDIRAAYHLGLVDDVVANRARRLADAASNLQHHAWTLREAAYAEADK